MRFADGAALEAWVRADQLIRGPFGRGGGLGSVAAAPPGGPAGAGSGAAPAEPTGVGRKATLARGARVHDAPDGDAWARALEPVPVQVASKSRGDWHQLLWVSRVQFAGPGARASSPPAWVRASDLALTGDDR